MDARRADPAWAKVVSDKPGKGRGTQDDRGCAGRGRGLRTVSELLTGDAEAAKACSESQVARAADFRVRDSAVVLAAREGRAVAGDKDGFAAERGPHGGALGAARDAPAAVYGEVGIRGSVGRRRDGERRRHLGGVRASRASPDGAVSRLRLCLARLGASEGAEERQRRDPTRLGASRELPAAVSACERALDGLVLSVVPLGPYSSTRSTPTCSCACARALHQCAHRRLPPSRADDELEIEDFAWDDVKKVPALSPVLAQPLRADDALVPPVRSSTIRAPAATGSKSRGHVYARRLQHMLNLTDPQSNRNRRSWPRAKRWRPVPVAACSSA